VSGNNESLGGFVIEPDKPHQEEHVTPGDPPEGLAGTVGGEFWKSGLCGPKGKPDIRVSFQYYPERGLGWRLKIELWRKDGKYWEDQKAFVYPIPPTADDLTACILDATKQVRLHAKLPPPNRRSVTPAIPRSEDVAVARAFKTHGTGRG
jgi:hypothetical protein